MADGFASAGANLFLVSRNLDEATATAEEIKENHPIEAVGTSSSCRRRGGVSNGGGSLGPLRTNRASVNNAGINRRGPIEGLSYDDFKAVQEINVNGVWLCARAVLPHMKGRGMGRIINLSSALGLVGTRQSHPLHGEAKAPLRK